jgi:hypothetical protein
MGKDVLVKNMVQVNDDEERRVVVPNSWERGAPGVFALMDK